MTPGREFPAGRADSWREMAQGAGIALFMRLAGAGCEVLLTLCVARMFGADGAGAFYIALTVVSMGSVFARLGLDNALLRLCAVYAAAGQPAYVASAARRGLLVASLVSLEVAALLYPALTWLAHERPALATAAAATQMMLPALPLLSLACLYGELFKSLAKIFVSQLVSAVALPALALFALLALGPEQGVSAAVAAYVAAAAAAALLGWLCWRKELPVPAAPGAKVAWGELLKGTGALLWIKSSRLAAGWLATAALALWTTQAEAGVFNVALRLSLGLGLLLMAVNSVAAPRFSAQSKPQDRAQLQRTARRAGSIALAAAMPVAAVMLLVPSWIMSWFGPEFAQHGGAVLLVLALGQCVNLLTGPVNYLLTMSGHEAVLGRCMTWSLGAACIAIAALTPVWGALGAAIGVSLAMTLQNLAAAWFVWDRLGIVTIPLLQRWARAQ